LFKLTSLNLNGIRSAATKGVEAWIAQNNPDCICVQEVKAQAPDVAGKFESLAGLKGHFHFAEKKGYSGVAVYSKHEPSDVKVGMGSEEFDAEGRFVELQFDTPKRKLSVISTYFPSGSSGPERQEAKFRFLDYMGPHLKSLGARARVHCVQRCEHCASASRFEKLEKQSKEQWLLARRARLDDAHDHRRPLGRCVPAIAS
jgi:exodeoxyribonuclease III